MILCVMGSCDIINPDDPVPSYVYIDDFTLNVMPSEGTGSELITEAWFYANGEFLGAYSMPALIPVIAEGPAEILVFPGIKVNGISITPDIYPFYERYEVDVVLSPVQIDTIQPETAYLSSVQFALIGDFETSNLFVDDLDNDPETQIERVIGGAFEGLRAGRIILDSDHPLIEVASLPLLDNLPTNSSPTYLEINYRNNIEFSIGLVGHQMGIAPAVNTVVFVRKRDEWSKIYIDLTEALFLSQLQAYQIFIRAVHDPANTESEIFLDNVKLVHFRP